MKLLPRIIFLIFLCPCSYGSTCETWGSWFSEEHGGYSDFFGQAFNGMACNGGRCDNKKLHYCSERLLEGSYTISGWFSDEGGPYTCPSGHVLSGIRCDLGNCDNMKYYCQKSRNFELTGSNSWTDWFSEEQGDKFCPNQNDVVIGIQCTGKDCDNLRLNCATIHEEVEDTDGVCKWTDFISEERRNLGTTTDENKGAIAFRCRGHRCDDISLLLCDYLKLSTKTKGSTPRSKSEEEGDNYCPPGLVISSITCYGGTCDNKALHCKRPDVFQLESGKSSAGRFSEEGNGMQQCPEGFLIEGIHCHGKACDNITLRCRQYTMLPSCAYGVDSNGDCTTRFEKSAGFWKWVSSGNGVLTYRKTSHYSRTDGKHVTKSKSKLFTEQFGIGYEFQFCTGATVGGELTGGSATSSMCHTVKADYQHSSSVENSITSTVLNSVTDGETRECATTSPPQCTSNPSGCVMYQWVLTRKEEPTKETMALFTCNFYFKYTGDITEKPNCVPAHCADNECMNCRHAGGEKPSPVIDETKGKELKKKDDVAVGTNFVGNWGAVAETPVTQKHIEYRSFYLFGAIFAVTFIGLFLYQRKTKRTEQFHLLDADEL